MIRHYNRAIQFNVVARQRQLPPFLTHNLAQGTVHHFTIDDIAKQQKFVVGADSNEVDTAIPIIVSLQSNGAATVKWLTGIAQFGGYP